MTAIAAPLTLRPGWWRTIWAVLLGWVAASLAMSMVQHTVAGQVEWPDPLSPRPFAFGWPWPLEGPWSLAADLGPALLYGGVFAWVAVGALGERGRRVPLALAAAALVLFVRGGAFIQVDLLSTVVLVVVLRRETPHTRRPVRWTPLAIALTVLAVPALATATVSYGRLNALSATSAMVTTSKKGREYLTVSLRALGNDIVNVASIDVPGQPDVVVRAWSPAGSTVHSVEGASIHPGESVDFALRMPNRCAGPSKADRLDVRMKVGDRDHHQVVRIGWSADIPCE